MTRFHHIVDLSTGEEKRVPFTPAEEKARDAEEAQAEKDAKSKVVEPPLTPEETKALRALLKGK